VSDNAAALQLCVAKLERYKDSALYLSCGEEVECPRRFVVIERTIGTRNYDVVARADIVT
jgi:hypothetical protein